MAEQVLWTPGAWVEGSLMLHSGRNRRPFPCDKAALGRILDAYEPAVRDGGFGIPFSEIQRLADEPPAPAHSTKGASGYSRWSVCPGSVALSEGLESPDSEYAAEGTRAHAIAQACLQEGCDAWEKVAEADDADMTDHVQLYLDTIRGDIEEYRAAGHGEPTLLIEHKFSLEALGHPDCFGTADCVVMFPAWGLLRIYDLKYGAGMVVEVKGNGQLRYYAAGCTVTTKWAPQEVESIIVQPRAEHPDGPARRERLTIDELNTWVEGELLPAIKRTEDPAAPLVEGPHCRFCPAKDALVCPLLENLSNQLAVVADATGKDAAIAAARKLEDWELTDRLSRVGPVEMYIRALKAEAFARLTNGVAIPGFKLVRKKADRVLKDGGAEAAREKWGDDALSEPVLKSPAQLEKLPGGKPWAAEWAFKPNTGHTMVPDTNKREAVRPVPIKERFAAALAAQENA